MDRAGLDLEGKKLGKYDITMAIGRGGMGTVYKATDTTLRRTVALKVLLPLLALDDAFVQRFQHEAVTAANLKHPHIVTIYEVGEQDGLYYIAMEYLPGCTLQQIIAEEGSLNLDRAVRFFDQIADALTYAHHQGLIHRDVKPSNIIVDDEDHATLTDFGIARAAESATGLTATHTRVGTPRYMSPEHALGAELDHRSDIYSLGIVLYEMLTGKAPFEGKTTSALLYAHVHQPPPAPSSVNPSIPGRVEHVLLKALAKRPNQRYQEANAMAQAFREAVENSKVVGASGLPAFVPTSMTRLWRVRRPAGLIVVAGIGLVMITLAFATTNLGSWLSGNSAATRSPVQVPPVVVLMTTATATRGSVEAASPTPTYTATAGIVATPTTEQRRSTETLTPPTGRTPSPTLRPTATLVPLSSPATTRPPTPTESPIGQRLPTPGPPKAKSYPIVIAISPEDGASLEPGTVLRWDWDGQLAENEYFDVRVWKEGQPHYGIGWTKTSEYILPTSLGSGDGEYFWSIAVIRGRDGHWEADLSQESPPRIFTFTAKEGGKPKCSDHPDLRPPDCE